MYKVYGKVNTRTFRVLWLLEELGEPYQLIEAGPRSDAIMAVNPSGKVPAMQVGDDILTDSTAILTYLADKHGAFTYPAGTIERAQQDALVHMLLDEFDSNLWMATRHTAILPEDKRVPAIAPSLQWEFEKSVARLDARFVGPFLQGDKMTIADIIATNLMGWAHFIRFPINSEKLKAYGKAMCSREAYTRTQNAAAS